MNRIALLLMTALALFALCLAYQAAAPDSAEAQVRPHQCYWCHSLHGAGPGGIPLTGFNADVDLCTSCHDPAGPADTGPPDFVPIVSRDVAIHAGPDHRTAPLDETTCWDCHRHWGLTGGNNLKNIPEQLVSKYPLDTGETKTIVFTARTGPNSFAEDVFPYDGPCEVCHTLTNHHRNDGSGPGGPHNAQAECTTCHSHDSGFQPQGGGCTSCHNSAQNARRPIVPEFDYTSHHIDWVTAGYATAQDIPDAQCRVCHLQDNVPHTNGGIVLLNDVDVPANGPYRPTNANELEAFCLGCHSNNGGVGVGGTAPFADNLTPPEVDATLWNASSHSASVGACLNCHMSGHGSQKTKLLGRDAALAGGGATTPNDVAATAPALAEQEEGFCWNCHDADGPSTTDIAGLFAPVINWVDQGLGPGNTNTNINDRHDVEFAAQQVSGAKIECTDCHNPHEATTAQPYIADPDPGVIRPQFFTGLTAWSEFCLDCHDNTFPATVTAPTNPLSNIDDHWSPSQGGGQAPDTDNMGFENANNTDLTAGTGWSNGDLTLECFNCHTAHPSPSATVPGLNNLASLRTSVPDIVTDDPTQEIGLLNSVPIGTLDYSYTTNAAGASADVDIGYYCMTCHDLTASMWDRDYCESCHQHGSGRF